MYWQVYLHKTSLVAEQLLIRVLKRAKELTTEGEELNCSKALKYFLKNPISFKNFTQEVLKEYAKLDDSDIISAMKEWQYHEDYVLKQLCKMIINRNLLRIELSKNKINIGLLDKHVESLVKKDKISRNEAQYFVFSGEISNQAYQENYQTINILYKTGDIEDIVEASDQLNLRALSKPVSKYYICYPND